MTNTGVSIGVFNARIVSLRFFFGVTCAREGKHQGPPPFLPT
jgi:integrase/recombinase XerD